MYNHIVKSIYHHTSYGINLDYTHQSYIINRSRLNSEIFQFCLGLVVTPSQNVPDDKKQKLHSNLKGLFSSHKSKSLCRLYQEKIKTVTSLNARDLVKYDPWSITFGSQGTEAFSTELN